MKISSWEEKKNYLLTLAKAYHWPVEKYESRSELIESTYKEFPFVVTVEGGWHEFDEADTIAWNLFGPRDGKCNQYIDDCHVSCPMVLEIKNKIIQEGLDPYDSSIETPEHSHSGCWQYVPIAKTGYDYGFGSYCFKNEEDKNKFIQEMKL